MPVNINAKLNIAVSQQSVAPAITSIQNAFRGKKIPLEVELKIPKEIDREVYRTSRAFEVLDKRLISLKIHAGEALFSVQSFVTAISGVGKSLNQTLTPATKSLDQVARAVTSVTKTVNQAEKSTGGLAEAIGASTKRFVSFAIAAGVIANVVFQLQKGFSAALQFDRELVKFKQVGGDSATVIRDISDEVSRLAKGLGVSSSDLVKSAITLRQAGLSAKETKIALDALAKTSLAPTFDSIGNTTEAVIATLAQFKKGAGELEKQLGSINRVSADYAVESGDLTEAIRRTGGAFVAAGGNLEELLGLFTSVRATTRESSESIATSFRTIFARLQQADTVKNLRDIGVELHDLQGRFVGPFEAVKRLNAAFAELPQGSSQFAAVVEQVGGIRQISKVIPLIQQFPLAVKAYNTALEGQSSLSKDAAIAQEAFLNKIQKLKESMLDLFRTIVSNDAFGALLNQMIAAAQAATNLVGAFKPLIPLLTAISVFKFGNFLRTSGTAFKSGFAQTRFASGGTVPSAPNSGIRIGTDTVPAVLTEGEYVIKRSAAQKIGYDTLDQLNAYADGGIVSVNDRKKAAMLVMNRRAEDSKDTISVTVPKEKLGKDIQLQIPENAAAVKGIFTVAGPSSRYQQTNLKDSFKNSVKDSIARLASSVFGVKVKKVDDSIYSNVINPQGQGRLFESVLQSIAGSKVNSSNQDFDFPKPIHGELAEVFPGSKGKYGDAKLSQNNDSEANMVSKMIRQFGINKRSRGNYDKVRKEHSDYLKPFKGEERVAEKGRIGVNVFPPPRVAKPKVAKFASGGVVGGRRGGGRGIRMSGGGMATFGGRIKTFATGGRVKVEEEVRSNFDDKFLQEITNLTNRIEKMRNQVPLAPHYGLGIKSDLPPIQIARDTPPPIGLSYTNQRGIPLENAPSTGFNSNLPPIGLDQDISGIPLTRGIDRIRSSYLDAKRSGRAAAREHFGSNLSGMSGAIELGSVAKEVTSSGNGLVGSIKSAFNKITSAFQSSSKQVVQDSTKFSVEVVDGVKKVVGRVVKNGKETVFATEKTYLSGKQAGKTVNKIEDLISSGKYSAEDILSSGKFKQIGSSEKLGRFGKAGKFFKENGNALGISAALTLPYLSQTTFGDAEKPGSFGTTGARVGGALTAGAEGGFLGAQAGAAFGPQGAIIGGVIGALGSVVFSLKQFDDELQKVNSSKISKAFSELNIDATTGKVGNASALSTVQEGFSKIKDLDLVLDKDKYLSVPANLQRGKDDDRDSRFEAATKQVNEQSDQLIGLLKSGITANPKQDLSKIGPKIVGGLGAFDLLKRTGNTKAVGELQDFQKAVKRSTDITSKINALQEQAFLSLKDLNTAMEIFSNTVEQAGDKFQKNAAFNAVGSEALAGKVSAGSSGPNIGLFNQFGKNIEEFAKPGGQLDESRKYISEAIRFGLKSQKGLNSETAESDQLGQSASEAGKYFLQRSGNTNGFGKSIADAIENVLSSNFLNTAKIPGGEEQLLAKLTEDVAGRFKNIQAVRNSNNSQLASVFGNYNQQLGSSAERRGVVLQREAEINNRAVDFNLSNLQTREAASGSLTRFIPGGAVSSQEFLAQKEISAKEIQRQNQLSALGISPKDATSGNELNAKLQQAQSQLGKAQIQQKNATNINEYQAATKKIVELTFTISNLKKGMDLLANSTSVLDAKNKALNVALDQQRQDLEGRRSDAEVLTFGTAEEKQRLAYKEQLTQTALQNPNALQFATDEEKQLVRERLRESNITRSFQEYDKFGRARGTGFVNSQQQLEGLTNPIYQQLLRTPGAQYNRMKVGNAQAGVEAEQNLLNANAKVNNNVDFNDVKEQRRLMDQNFNEYIKNINDGLTKNAAAFDQFSDSVGKFADAVDRIPTSIQLQSTNDHNVNVVGIDRASSGIRKAVEAEAFTAFVKWARENKVLTEDSVA